MPCAICTTTTDSAKNLYTDCIIESLDKIKAHYIHFKSQLDDRYREITRLQLRNDELTRCITSLKYSPKRRKTSSFDDSPSLSEQSASDSLNEAIRVDNTSIDESFFIGTQKSQENSSQSGTPDNVLKSTENCTPPVRGGPLAAAGLLPQRLKAVARKSTNQTGRSAATGPENKSPKWTSKQDTRNVEGRGNVKRDWNMSFMKAPTKCKGSPKTSPKENKTLLSLRKEAKLKQSRLKFENSRIEDDEETIVQETDATFCGDLIAASPTTVTSASHYETIKSRTGRKFNRPKFASLSSFSTNDQSTKVNNVKAEPPSQVKRPPPLLITRTSPKSSPETPNKSKDPDATSISGIQPHSEASVCILPSPEKDVIYVEDSNANVNVNIDSDTLFDAMMVKSDETSDFLRKIEEKCIENVRNEQGKQNEVGSTTSGNTSPGILSRVTDRKPILPLSARNKLNLTKPSTDLDTTTKPQCNKPKIIPKWNCKECETYYSVAGRSMDDEELQKRMKHCLEKHRSYLCDTPEGFWNPCFPATPDDDPRYMTLIESRPVEKKKSSI